MSRNWLAVASAEHVEIGRRVGAVAAEDRDSSGPDSRLDEHFAHRAEMEEVGLEVDLGIAARFPRTAEEDDPVLHQQIVGRHLPHPGVVPVTLRHWLKSFADI